MHFHQALVPIMPAAADFVGQWCRLTGAAVDGDAGYDAHHARVAKLQQINLPGVGVWQLLALQEGQQLQ